ncbi:hypothetical protein Kpol_479p26 [Vanderwaltozyma polyspora DSM 70294]|uniref:Matrin-type domain-containing protein n=1 Tax=Vanderwaltozyma polyspora (strain ATCC 22028 / DSM 70294 / BCRC 21397 / CBS 2163 / NBRC 10782 / NRRL Y-8283 / UCD 57-17) TaxID=436907 RepID=A7TQD9_VANPO|nr:uncharacterized protein Kpol_479p26 [Vanderwaltozyma polyspora DSM 70294]EDO15538.1 hypothetical protein Kpol_479p26 [Vanderwaltozyma polyspora DSM 70294]
MSYIENVRSLLEDIEVIEDAISKRFQRNPEVYYYYSQQLNDINGGGEETKTVVSNRSSNRIYKSRKHKRDRKQVILQQYETNEFIKDIRSKLNEIREINVTKESNGIKLDRYVELMGSIDTKYEDSVSDNQQLPINKTIFQYSMFTSSNSKNKPNNILSDKCKYLEINDYFTRDEQYGEYLELERFYNNWLNVIKSANCSILQYMSIIEKFLDSAQYILQPPMDRKNERYLKFLEIIETYLTSFIKKTYVLIDWEEEAEVLKYDYEIECTKSLMKQGKGNFCRLCGKWFKTESVFENHLPGKNHVKNYKKYYDEYFIEFKIHRILNWLSKEFEETKLFLERKLAFTSDERIKEIDRMTEVYERPAYSVGEPEEGKPNENSSKTSSNKNDIINGSFDMPLGPDGLPMPYWLYKLQGLDMTYKCEICANTIYKGRRTFEKHFSETTHNYHLRCLGIEPSSAFKGIVSIKEATDLWGTMNVKDKSSKHAESNNYEIEVEDKEGNVLSKEIYEELKKQGLL